MFGTLDSPMVGTEFFLKKKLLCGVIKFFFRFLYCSFCVSVYGLEGC